MSVFSGHEGTVFASTGASVTLTNAATTANGARTRYQITDAAKRYLTRLDTVTVETSPDGAVWTPAVEGTDYTLTRIGGIAEFAVARAVGTQVRISGKYLAVVELGNLEGWSFEVSREVYKPVILRQDFKSAAYGPGDSKGSISRLWLDGDLFDTLSARTELVLVLYVNYDSTLAYGVYSNIASLKVDNSGDALVSEDVDFEGIGTPYYPITL